MFGARRRKTDLYSRADIFCHCEGLVNTQYGYTIHTRGEGGDPNQQRKVLRLNFSCLALKYEFYFITPYSYSA